VLNKNYSITGKGAKIKVKLSLLHRENAQKGDKTFPA